MINLKDLEFLNGKMGHAIQGIGKLEKWMGREKYKLLIIKLLKGFGLMGNISRMLLIVKVEIFVCFCLFFFNFI
jgi:hypothetical protein